MRTFLSFGEPISVLPSALTQNDNSALLCSMNENSTTIELYVFMGTQEGWGRPQGRQVYQKLIAFVEATPGVLIFKVSLAEVKRVDISFASETVIELAHRYRGHKGFCLVDLTDQDMLENWDAAAARKGQPMMVWKGK